MKSELVDIQTALNACRLSLDNLSLSENMSRTSKPRSNPLVDSIQPIRKQKKQRRTRKPKTTIKPKRIKPKRNPNSIICSSNLDSLEQAALSSMSSTTNTDLNYNYPLSSAAYNFQCSSPTSTYKRNFTSHKYKALTSMSKLDSYLIPVTTYSSNANRRVSRKKSILINRKCSYKHANIRVFNHFKQSQCVNVSYKSRLAKNATGVKLVRYKRVEQTRNDHARTFQNIVHVSSSNSNISSEKSLLKYRNISPISACHSPGLGNFKNEFKNFKCIHIYNANSMQTLSNIIQNMKRSEENRLFNGYFLFKKNRPPNLEQYKLKVKTK